MNIFVEGICSFLSETTGVPPANLEPSIEQPPDASLGDYAFPCFALARQLRKDPKIIAEGIAARFRPTELLEKAEVTGAYLNFFINRPKFIEIALSNAAKQGDSYGTSDEGRGKTVVIDYSSPNIAKHLGVHHLPGTVIGQGLYNIYTALGYDCVGINHLGDWGRQFGEIIVAYQLWGSEEELERTPVTHLNSLYVKFHDEAGQDPSLEDRARITFKKLEDGDPETRALWEHFRDVSVQQFEKAYRLLRISFDHYVGESFYNDMTADVIQRLQSSGLARESEGALIVDLSEYGMPPALVQTSAESTVYHTRDICAAQYRFKTYNFHRMLYVVGSEQRLHFKQLFKVLELMGYKWVKRCVHVDFGLLRFKDGKFSTREGRVILMHEVLERAISLARSIIEEKSPELDNKEDVAVAVGIGAVKFADMRARRTKDVIFDWDKVLSFEGETGPYLQYTCVRLSSILAKQGEGVPQDFDASLLTEPEELELARLVDAYNGILRRAAGEYEPSILASYLIQLATVFNHYYHNHRVLCDDVELRGARLVLVSVLRSILRSGLALLGIETPERM